MSDASTRGRRNRAAGNSAERELVRWLNDVFDIGAKTTRAVGHGTQSLCGDIMIPGHPDIVIECKNTERTHVAEWLEQLWDECAGMFDPLAMLAWRTSPRVEEWVWIVTRARSGRDELTADLGPLDTPTMRDCAGAIRLGFDDLGDIGDPFWNVAGVCSGRMAADLIGARVVGGGA